MRTEEFNMTKHSFPLFIIPMNSLTSVCQGLPRLSSQLHFFPQMLKTTKQLKNKQIIKTEIKIGGKVPVA